MHEITVVDHIADFRDIVRDHRRAGDSIGFVPTMGSLHDGHASLMRRAAAETDLATASIFVNPLQFGPGEDYASYPRNLDRDTDVAAEAGVDLVFAPSAAEMYPDGAIASKVSVSGLDLHWEGESRPGHFDGVATVVTKLFNIAGPCRAYFGEKDFQQLTIIQTMVHDLSMPVVIVPCPTVREPDGLAMSSRNANLDRDERRAATCLIRALEAGRSAIAEGLSDATEIGHIMAAVVEAEPLARLDYAAPVTSDTLEVPPVVSVTDRLIVAAHVGQTRLIDNCSVVDNEAHTRAESPHRDVSAAARPAQYAETPADTEVHS
jgi:pantoate--beta-alanine ligase